MTLATPYFFARDSAAGSKFDTFAAILVALYFSGLLVTIMFAPGSGIENPFTVPLVVLALGAILLQFFGWLFFRFSHGAPSHRDVQEAATASIQTPEIPEHEKVDDLLVVRAADDEAGAVLGAAQFSGWLGFTGARLAKPARLILLLWLASFVLYELDAMGDDFFGSRVAPIYDFLLDWLFPAFAALVLLITIPRIAALAHGWDGPAVTRFAVVSAEASPPGNSTVWQRQIRESRANGLAHSSLYDDPVVIRRVVSHIANGGAPDASE